jgi:hypothetical protein
MTAKRPSTLLLSGAIAGFMVSTALAQASNYTSIEVPAGKAVQLTYHASANKNCAPAPPPTVRVTQPPKGGALIVRKAMLTTDKIAGCPKLKTPAQVVFYQARADYAGPDHVGYEATDSNAEVASYDVSITVQAGAGAHPAGRRDGDPSVSERRPASSSSARTS